MADGPLFPKKSEVDQSESPGSHVEIERSDDPGFGKTTRRTPGGMPTMPGGKPIGCSTSVFALLLIVAALVAGAVAK